MTNSTPQMTPSALSRCKVAELRSILLSSSYNSHSDLVIGKMKKSQVIESILLGYGYTNTNTTNRRDGYHNEEEKKMSSPYTDDEGYAPPSPSPPALPTHTTHTTPSPTPTSISASASSSSSHASHSPSSSNISQPEIDTYADVRSQLNDLIAAEHLIYATTGTHPTHPQITSFAALTTYLGYAVLIAFGHLRDFFGSVLGFGSRYSLNDGRSSTATVSGSTDDDSDSDSDSEESKDGKEDTASGYSVLLKSWENFYTRRLYHRIQDVFNRPVGSGGAKAGNMEVYVRTSDDGNKTLDINYANSVINMSGDGEEENGVTSTVNAHVNVNDKYDENGNLLRTCLNLGSYNYLGFADDWGMSCKSFVDTSFTTSPKSKSNTTNNNINNNGYPISCSSSRMEIGTTSLHVELERTVSRFLNREDCIILNMGFNTNATTIPILATTGDLLISDSLNHTSIVNGARASGADIRVFKHNDTVDLARVLEESIVYGQPRTRRPWGKIIVMVEGIYSMEGEYCSLAGIVKVCKQFGVYLYLDEAHSIGAMGATGRGCTEYCSVDSRDVDVLMGTFTKSFSGMGGYIAGDKTLIDSLRIKCAGSSMHNSISPIVCKQVIRAFQVITGEDGTSIGARKIKALKDNSNYFRMKLKEMGLHVLGSYDSPIIPVMLYNPTKIAAFSRECLKRNLAVVVVGFPAVPILLSRVRFCVSAGHTREELDKALEVVEEVSVLLKLKYNHSVFG